MVVLHLDYKDDSCAGGGDEIGNKEKDSRADTLFNTQHKPLTHKAEAAQGHHAETGQRDTVGLAGANGLNGLRQIT